MIYLVISNKKLCYLIQIKEESNMNIDKTNNKSSKSSKASKYDLEEIRKHLKEALDSVKVLKS